MQMTPWQEEQCHAGHRQPPGHDAPQPAPHTRALTHQLSNLEQAGRGRRVCEDTVDGFARPKTASRNAESSHPERARRGESFSSASTTSCRLKARTAFLSVFPSSEKHQDEREHGLSLKKKKNFLIFKRSFLKIVLFFHDLKVKTASKGSPAHSASSWPFPGAGLLQTQSEEAGAERPRGSCL